MQFEALRNQYPLPLPPFPFLFLLFVVAVEIIDIELSDHRPLQVYFDFGMFDTVNYNEASTVISVPCINYDMI
jgi:hypothetical protein